MGKPGAPPPMQIVAQPAFNAQIAATRDDEGQPVVTLTLNVPGAVLAVSMLPKLARQMAVELTTAASKAATALHVAKPTDVPRNGHGSA